jgi:phospholipid/cholesterol/gamma-HCH transport system substrate-binding protein
MKRRNEVLVGLVVIGSILLVIFGTIWMQGRQLGREETPIKAFFDQVGQLQDGNPVKVSGVLIGRVDDIALDSAGRGVIVTMRIRSDAKLPFDPVVVLAPASMFGDWAAEIVPRSAATRYNKSESPDDPTALPGASLPDIGQLTQVAGQIADNLAALSDRFQLAFTEETASNIRRVIDNIGAASEQLTGLITRQLTAVDAVATDLRATARALGEAVGTANRLFAQVESAVSEDRLVNIVSATERVSLRIDSLSNELLRASRALQTMSIRADTTLRSVGNLADVLANGQGSLGLMLRDSTMYWKIIESNTELQALLKDLRLNPRRYINVRVF